jgi:cyclohexyl-isocyanide hydratase
LTYRIFAKTTEPVRDVRGLTITPDAVLTDAPQLDLLHVPGGFGQESVMDDEEILSWVQQQAAGARCVFSVCTGALICGAAGLLKGRRATTHWSAFHLLPLFGAIPSNERVVVDGEYVFAAGVTAGIDGALLVAAALRGDEVAQIIQLHLQYAPEPPFNSGKPETAPAEILEKARHAQSRHGAAGVNSPTRSRPPRYSRFSKRQPLMNPRHYLQLVLGNVRYGSLADIVTSPASCPLYAQ